MKRLFIMVVCILVMGISIFARVEMKFEKTTIDFGEVDSGKPVDMEFKFVNAGNENLVISGVNTSCGCTAAKLDKMEYKPGERGVLPVKFDSKGYNGPVIKTITINTNDKENPYTRLEIKGTVKLTQFAELEFAPGADRVDFKTVKVGQSYTNKIKVKNSGTIPLQFKDILTYPEIYVVFPKKDLNPKEQVEIKVVFTPMQAGPFSQFIRITSNAYKQRMMVVKVTADAK
ncbi:MAG: DUF1573 domain-containing protein [Candidatus Omnitrophota bacterium]